MAPRVSVITVVLNDRPGFAATAGSILEQTYPNFEWIVVDGGSTNGTLDAIRAHAARIATLHSGPDRGVYDAMNHGLGRARGEFVVFMNAGDRFAEPATLARVAAAIDQAARPIDILFGGTILELPTGARVYRPPHPAAARLRYGLPAYHQATFIRRELHQAVPHDLAYQISSDYYTIARMCRDGARTVALSAPIARHDFGRQNLSKRATFRRFQDFVAIQRRVLDKGWPEIAVNTGRLACVHAAYLVVTSTALGPLASPLLAPWRVQAGPERVSAPAAAGRRAGPDPGLIDGAALRRDYDALGYVVVPGLIPGALCDRARAAFAAEVKPYTGHLYRQTTSHAERHVFTDHGYLLNPILNIQSLRQSRFPNFRAAGLEILTEPGLQRAVGAILGEPGKIVQSMYFEGNSATWAHRDAYYLDSAGPGGMLGAWIALEDIAAGAGRFYVCPKSHLVDMAANRGDLDIAFHHDRYKQHVRDVIAAQGLVRRAPALRRGDVLLWSTRTIHGSLETTEPEHSRSSITAHLLAASSDLLQFQRRRRRLAVVEINGVQMHLPKNQNAWGPRAVLWAEATFPRAFQLAKKAAIKSILR